MSFGVADHLVDNVLVKRRLARDGHRLLVVRRTILGRHVDYPIGIDIESDLDLRSPPWGRWDIY